MAKTAKKISAPKRKTAARPLVTTLSAIRAQRPCESGWKTLVTSLGGIKAYGLKRPLKLSQILESNGIEDTYWVQKNVLGKFGDCTAGSCLACELEKARTKTRRIQMLDNPPEKFRPAK